MQTTHGFSSLFTHPIYTLALPRLERFWKWGQLTLRLNKPCLSSLWCIPANSIYSNIHFFINYDIYTVDVHLALISDSYDHSLKY